MVTMSFLASPWSSLTAARAFLCFLVDGQRRLPLDELTLDAHAAAEWLTEQGLAPLAFLRCRVGYPDLVPYLEGAAFSAVAGNSLRCQNLAQVAAAFQEAQLPLVLLKGAALVEGTYGGWEERTMSDIDLWLRPATMARAMRLMESLGFQSIEQAARPLSLQALAGGEVQYWRPHEDGWRTQDLVELHLSPFPGWWLRRTAAIDTEGLWARLEPLKDAYQLSAEDTIIHLAVHLAVNHQFGRAVIRSLLDIAMTAQARQVDWKLVAQRARQWRVGVAVWLTLSLLEALFAVENVETALVQLRPSRARRRMLARFVTPTRLLEGADPRRSRARLLLLLLLVDRPQDMGYLAYRTIWPEDEWLEARYDQDGDHWQHLWRLVRSGEL